MATAYEQNPPRSLVELAFNAYQRNGYHDQYLVKQAGAWKPVSGVAFRHRVDELAAGLRELGVEAGSRVALMAHTCLEWVLCDLATLRLGAVLVPVYPTLSTEQVAWILRDSEASVAVGGAAEEMKRLREAAAAGVNLVSIEPSSSELTLAEVEDRASRPLDQPLPRAEDLATIIYTSGTTGEPKGVMLSHGNIVSNVLASEQSLGIDGGVILSFLPLSHVFERMASYFYLRIGARVAFAESMQVVADNLREVCPDGMIAVPRVLEKVAGKLEAGLAAAPPRLQRLARWALSGATEAARLRIDGQPVPLPLKLRSRVADLMAFRRLRKQMGGRLKWVVAGGAATSDELVLLFEAAGVSVLPGYGLSESSPVIAVSSVAARRLGSVGRPLPGVEVRIAEDGEILTRGPHVMRGYWQNQEATRLALGPDGWLRTGDIGRMDEQRFLWVTDRKKEILVTAGGKNVAPQPIERLLCSETLIEQAMLVGDGRRFISALLVPSMRQLECWAHERGLETSDRSRLVEEPAVQRLYAELVERCNQKLARFEAVKRFVLLDRELSQERGELTPTLKLRRKVVEGHFRDRIEQLYQEGSHRS